VTGGIILIGCIVALTGLSLFLLAKAMNPRGNDDDEP
jgi:hypothetical protein